MTKPKDGAKERSGDSESYVERRGRSIKVNEREDDFVCHLTN